MKKVLITGATSGIGEALLEKYQNNGDKVTACGRNKSKLTRLNNSEKNIDTLEFDITDKNQIAAAAQKVSSIDILILNAGDCAYIDDVKSFDGDKFSNIIKTNLISVGYLLQYFLPKLTVHGQIVFISSSATILPFSRAQAYGASKAGLDYLAKSLRLDLAPHNIDVTLVHPGFVKTPLTNKNTFDMPFMITSTQAAESIFKAVSKRQSYLQFPKRLTYILKTLAFLPDILWLWLTKRSMTK